MKSLCTSIILCPAIHYFNCLNILRVALTLFSTKLFKRELMIILSSIRKQQKDDKEKALV